MSTSPWVVGVDGSAVSQTALEWTIGAAGRHGQQVQALHVWRWEHAALGLLAPDAPALLAVSARDGLAAQVEAALAARPADAPAVQVDRRTAEGDPAVEMVRAAQGAGLLVLGRHGQGGFLRRVVEPALGSVAGYCLTHSPVPVVIVPPHTSPAGPRRIVVGVDGSASGTGALRWAAEHGRAASVPVTAVLTWQLTSVPAPKPQEDWAVAPLADWEDAARRLLRATVHEALGESAEVEQLLLHRPAAAGLLETVRTDDLLVLGDRGRGGFARLLLGSVSRQCAEHAPCPVVVVPQRAGRGADADPPREGS